MNNKNIFKAYDIRGIYPEELNEEFAEKLGRAFATFIDAPTIAVGRDMRTSSPTLSEAFIKGIRTCGKNVCDIGLISTDITYFAAGKLNMPSVMITASHNPPQYNGFKFSRAGALPIGIETGLLDIQKILEEETFATTTTTGTLSSYDIIADFVTHVHGMIDVSTLRPLRVAVDAGNGMAGYVVPKIMKNLPMEIVPLYFELDGTFPNHEPSPIELENVQDLIAKVTDKHCDLGLAFDGDADRVFFIDEQGRRIASSLIVALIAKQFLQEHPHSTIIYNSVCSMIVPETIILYDGTPVRERVGHSFIKETMKRTNALFAGEHSGHYYFLNNFRADSGIIAAMIVLEIISRSQQPLSALLYEFEKYFAIEETNSIVEDKQTALTRIRTRYHDAKTIDELDGLTFTYDDFWFNVRGSNTEPKLRLNLEAKTIEIRDAKTKEILEIIRATS